MTKILNDSELEKNNVKVSVPWHPKKELSFARYKDMVTDYVQSLLDYNNAKTLYPKKFTDW